MASPPTTRMVDAAPVSTPAQRVPQHVHGGRAAIGVLQQPAQRQAELPGEIDGGIGRERERCHRHAVDVAGVEPGVRERRDDGVADEGVGRLPRLRPARIGRLSHADDGGVHAHPLSRFVMTNSKGSALRRTGPDVSLRDSCSLSDPSHAPDEIRNPRRHEDRLGCPDRHGRWRGVAGRRLSADRRRPISRDPELRALCQGARVPGGLQERLAAPDQGVSGVRRRLQQQVPELGAGRPGEMGAGRLRHRAGRFPRRRPLAGLSRGLVAARGQGPRTTASNGRARRAGRTARSASTAFPTTP